MSEPEVDALVRAIVARPTSAATTRSTPTAACCCGRAAPRPTARCRRSTSGRGSSSASEAPSSPATRVHSVFEDFTWDKSTTMSGAADDWAYEHLGVFGWTTEFWDVIAAATGERASTDFWYVGPDAEQELAVVRWADEHAPDALRPLARVRPPPARRRSSSAAGTCRRVDQPAAGLLPRRDRAARRVRRVPGARLAAASTCSRCAPSASARAPGGWWPASPTPAGCRRTSSARARKERLVLPLVAELVGGDGVRVVDGPARRQLGQLEGTCRHALHPVGGRDARPRPGDMGGRSPEGTGRPSSSSARHPRAGGTNRPGAEPRGEATNLRCRAAEWRGDL